MAETTDTNMRVEDSPDQYGSPQDADPEEDLDALVDLETQRIMDEADLLDFVSLWLLALQPQRTLSQALDT